MVGRLEARAAAPLLVIGKDVFHRHDLAQIDCFNFLAAMRLSTAVATLGVTSTKDLFDYVAPAHLVLPQIGAVALAVLGAAFEAKGLGGDQPLEAWVLKHRTTTAEKIVTFQTLKDQECKRTEGETRARKQRRDRKHARRDQAHRLRVSRFQLRRGAAAHA